MFSRKEILDRQTALITGGASGIGHASDPTCRLTFNDRKRKRKHRKRSLHWRIDRRFPGNSLWYEQSDVINLTRYISGQTIISDGGMTCHNPTIEDISH